MKMITNLIVKWDEVQIGTIEAHINLHIQPKPKFLPKFIWKKILNRLLVMEKFIPEDKDFS